ncbi:MAG: hypothetical protein MPW16_02900 [Candidatus Manganitrophus sp.]|nr:MAG: hypothetical protein MPW16_02900 [Candidatus Manganitrophus sp.]
MFFPHMKKTMSAMALCGLVGFFILGCTEETQAPKGRAITPLHTPSQGAQAASSNVVSIQAGIAVTDVMVSLGEIAAGDGLGIGKPINPLTKANHDYYKMVTLSHKVARTPVVQKVRRMLKTANAPAPIASATTPCVDGGTMDLSGTFDSSTGNYELDFDFTDCREDSSQMNGPFHVSATASGSGSVADALMTLTFGDEDGDFSIQDYGKTDTNPYATLKGIITSSLTLTEDLSTTSGTAGTIVLGAEGTISFNDFINLTEIGFQGFTNEIRYDEATGRFDEVLNGVMTETKTNGRNATVITTFTDVITSVIETEAGGDTTTEVAYSGTLTLFINPDSDCMTQGTFNIETPTPIRTVNGACPVAGRVVINEDALIQFNADQSVDVSITGGSSSQHTDCTDIFEMCEVDDLNDNSEIVSVASGATVGVEGENVLVTLIWEDDTVDQSDIDLHVGYYADPFPTSGPATATVAFHNTGTTFGTASAILDLDDTDGQGPEHVTIFGMPIGRYVIAMNSFSLHGSASATVTVSIKIGDFVYLYPTHTFATDDGDGVDPNSWYRVADLQCTSSGCSLLPPDLNLQVHSTEGDFKPGIKRVK